jgi:hypothetical protein
MKGNRLLETGRINSGGMCNHVAVGSSKPIAYAQQSAADRGEYRQAA